MSLHESIGAAIDGHNKLAVALSKIALGRTDCGRPLAAEAARQLARDAIIESGMDWNHVLKVHAEFALNAIANKLDPNEIKPAPIVPRSISG